MRRLLERLSRAFSPARDVPAARAIAGMQAPTGEFDLSHTLPARLFLVSLVLLVPLLALQQFVTLPGYIEILRKVASISLILSGGWLGAVAIWLNRRWLFWRVRRKLILSYLLFGVVPVLLLVMFVLAGSVVLYSDFAAFLLQEGVRDVLEDVRGSATAASADIRRGDIAPADVLETHYAAVRDRYRAMSFALVPAAAILEPVAREPPPPLAAAGPWGHVAAPASVPAWVAEQNGFGLRGDDIHDGEGLVALPGNGADGDRLVLRAVAPVAGGLMVVADLPVDTEVIGLLHQRTKTRIESVAIAELEGPNTATTRRPLAGAFRRTIARMDAHADWPLRRVSRVEISLSAPVGGLYERLTDRQSSADRPLGLLIVVIGVLLLIVQIAAIVIGSWLGRSITSAVHELFTGTQRVQQGDFAHRIEIESRDQLGELADSFNRMSASIGHLLHVQRDKQRMDDELRIARDIQQSLLPVDPPRLDGLSIADLCEPAREVGGDYYDFFLLGPRQLGVVVADVSGKGTSAALYMAELKGLMLALSHAEPSPRRLLIDVNRRLAGQLDNRSFITMAYAVIDLDAMTMRFARAGHTPLIVVSGDEAELLAPAGMVLGLRIPGALERFEQILAEETRALSPGDLVVLYTDGLTEAMDGRGELFGDTALAGLLARHRRLAVGGIRERVLREVKGFVGDAEPHDDMTMVILKLTGGTETA